MVNQIAKVRNGSGWRAGMAAPVVMRPGGTRDITCIIPPMNPYNNPFNPRVRPVLALAWETGRHRGMMQGLQQWLFRNNTPYSAAVNSAKPWMKGYTMIAIIMFTLGMITSPISVVMALQGAPQWQAIGCLVLGAVFMYSSLFIVVRKI